MTTFLRANPLFLAVFPPDFVDAEGIPILEADTFRFPAYADVVQYVPFTMNDARREAGLPINMEALKRIQATPELWKAAAIGVKRQIPMNGLALLQKMLIVADAYYCLPYVLEARESKPQPIQVGNLFRFFRGIAHYSRHRIVFEGGNDSARSMYQYTLDSQLFTSVRGVCPASKTLVDRVEKEFQTLLAIDDELFAEADLVCSAEQLRDAVRLSSSFEQFGIICALNYIELALAQRASGAPLPTNTAQPFPLPFLSWLKSNLTDVLPVNYVSGLNLLASGLPENADLRQELLEAIDRTKTRRGLLSERRCQLLDLAHRLNLRVADLLGHDGASDARAFERAFDEVMRRNGVATPIPS